MCVIGAKTFETDAKTSATIATRLVQETAAKHLRTAACAITGRGKAVMASVRAQNIAARAHRRAVLCLVLREADRGLWVEDVAAVGNPTTSYYKKRAVSQNKLAAFLLSCKETNL